METTDYDAIGAVLARELFAVGDDGPSMRTRRIQFMAAYDGAEIGMGGLAEKPLALFLAARLREHLSKEDTTP